MKSTKEILIQAKKHCRSINQAGTNQKNNALAAMADNLIKFENEILSSNKVDIDNAKGSISDVMIDRLMLNHERIEDMAEGLRDLINLSDPVGEVLSSYTLDNGLDVNRIAVPFGVIAIIYESRPNVTSDAAGLAIKSGNSVVLRSGREAINTACAIVKALKKGLVEVGISEEVIQLIEDTSRDSALELMTAKGFIDLLVPRGGAGLISSVVKNAEVPVIQTGTGICHVYIDKSADIDMALNIIDNAKTQRPSVCNAAEVCLVHKDIADRFLPELSKLFEGRVELFADSVAIKYLKNAKPAGNDDFDTEFLDYKMAVGIVDSTEDAINHINKHSTGHSECIVTNSETDARCFTSLIDSSAVYVNASTRFTDGGQFGLGCELGISTQKLHARGPMGLKEITTSKYIITGYGQVRE